MSRFEEKVLALKAATAQRVAQAKQRLMHNGRPTSYQHVNELVTPDSTYNTALDTAVSGSSLAGVRDTAIQLQDALDQQLPSPLQPNSPVIGQTPTGANIHEDGTYSVVDTDGTMHAGLTHEQAARYAVYAPQREKERKTGVPTGFLGRKAAGFKDQSVEVSKSLVQGAVIGATSLEEAVNDRNAKIKTQQEIVEMGVPTGVIPSMDPFFKSDFVTPPKPPITPEQIKQYLELKDSIVEPNELFKELAELEESAKTNKARFETTEKVATKLKEIFPGSYKDQMAAKAGYDAVAKDKGIWEAIKYTFDNDLGTLLSAGIDSTPWMIAYTMGGPLTQTGVITSLARAKGRQGIEEFKIAEGRNPDANETQRIKLWMAIGAVAEKYGDLSALRAFKGNLPFLKNVSKALAANTTSKVLSLPTIAALRVGTVLGGEALSGAITSTAEQIAKHGKVTDPATIAYDALAEAAGTPGGIATMYSGKLPYELVKQHGERKVVREADIKSTLEYSEKTLEQLNNNELRSLADSEKGKELLESYTFTEPLIADEGQIEIDENGYAKPTENEKFNKIYNDLFNEGGVDGKGLEWRDALKATKEIMYENQDRLTKPLTGEQKAQAKRNTKFAIEELKKALEEKKFSAKDKEERKELFKKDIPKKVYKERKSKEEKAKIKAQEAEVAAAETEAEKEEIVNRQQTEDTDEVITQIAEDKKSSNAKKVEALQELQKTKKLPLKDYQKKRVKDLLKEYTPAEVEGKTKEEESLTSLQELSDPTEENEKEHQDIIENLESEELSKTDKAVLAAAKKLRKYFNKLKGLGRRNKNLTQVDQEILFGTANGYKGFSTFRNEIVEKLDENKNADPAKIERNQIAIDNQLRGMKQHLENLKNKLKAFNEAKDTKPKKKGNIVVVRGTKNTDPTKSKGAARWMDYTLEEMTHADYLKLRKNTPDFVSYIHSGSSKLLNEIQNEIEYGEQAVIIAENHGSTSFFKAATQRAEQLKTDQVLADQIAALDKEVDLDVEDLTDADLAAIDDDTEEGAPSTPTTTSVKPIYANQIQSAEGIKALYSRLSDINIRIVDLGSLGTKRTRAENIEYDLLINEQKDIKQALSTPTTPVAPSSEGREGATAEETTPPVTETTPTEKETLTEEDYGIPETKEVVRFVAKSEVDALIKGEKIIGRDKDGRVDVTTDIEGQNVPATTIDYRIRFKDKDSSTVRMKSEQDGWVLDGYDINDVASIEEKQSDGSWKTVDLLKTVTNKKITTKEAVETKAPTTPIISKMREVVDLITADDFNGQEWINSFHGKIIESIGTFSIPKLKSMILARKESEAYDTYLRFLEIELEYRNAGGVKGGPLSPESLARLRWNIDSLAFDIEGYDPVTKTTRFDDRENKIEFDISAAKQKLKKWENDLKIRIDKALALVEDPANRTEDSAEKAAKAERERTIDERIAKAQEPLDKAVAKLKDAMPGSNKRAWIHEVTLLLDKVNAVRKKFKREPLPFPVKDKSLKEKLKIWNDAIKSLSKKEINTLNKYLNYSGKKKEFTKEDFVDFMLHPSSKKLGNTMMMNNPDGSVEFTKLGIASGAKAAAKLLFPALKIVQKLRQERTTDEIPTMEEQPEATTEDQRVEEQPPVSETTPPVTKPSAPDTTQDGDTEQEGPTKRKRIPLLSRTKQAFRTVFPQIITKEGTLVAEEELAKHLELVEELAEELDVSIGEERYDEIVKALEALPDAKNFIEEAVGYDVDPPKIATEKQLETALGEAFQKAKERVTDAFEKAIDIAINLENLPKNFLKRTAEAQKKILALHNKKYKYISSKKERIDKLKTVEERKLARPETILGIIGKTFKDLITMTTKKGIQTIPNFVFDDKQLLTQALLDLLPDSETKEATVKELVNEYISYKAKYDGMKWDANELIDKKSGNFADQPLSILHLYNPETKTNQLPNAVVFMMMLGTTNFVHQRSNRGNQPFMYNSEMDDFLYSGLEELSDNEREQLDNLGYNYRISSNQVGTQIIKALRFKSKLAPEYYDKLKTALGMQALQVTHGIFDYRTADKSFTDSEGKIGSPLTESDKDSANDESDAFFQIETYTWNFEDPFKENRNRNNPITKNNDGTFTYFFNGKRKTISAKEAKELNLKESVQGDYKHIRFNPDITIDEAGAIALAEINKALKLGLDEEQPLQEPEGEVNRKIRNSIGNIASKIVNTVKSQQKEVSWTGTESMSIVGLLANNGDKSRKIIDKQLGIDEAANDENTHQAKRKSLTSRNRTILANFNNTLRAFNSGTLKRFYVKYRLQNQLRYLMEGPVNAQQDKNVRYLVKPFKTAEFNEKNVYLFQLAVAFNFGIKVDKNNLPYVIKQFNAIVKDPKVLAAVQILNQINKIKDKSLDITQEELRSKLNEDGLLDQFAESLVPLNGAYSTNIALIGGLTALSKYMTVTGKRDDQKGPQEGLRKTTNSTFESDVPIEIDGISNGFMINILQFPNFQQPGNLTELIDLLSKVGMYPGKTSDDVTHNIYAPDSYQSLAMLMKKYTDPNNDEIKEYVKKNELTIVPEETKALHELYKDLVDKSGNLELLRDLVKYPFLIYLYGGGVRSISEGVGKNIYKDLIDQLDRHQKDYNVHAKVSSKASEQFIKETWTPFLTNLITIGALGNYPEAYTKRLRENTTQTLKLNEVKVIKKIGILLRPRLDLSLQKMLGVTTESRSAVIKAGELLNAMFIVKFEKLYAAHLKETGREYLTEKEVNEFIRTTDELNDYYPEYQVPLAKEGETATIDLTKRVQTNKEDRVGEVEVSYFSVVTGQKKVNKTTTRTFEFELPGPAALTRSIMNIDSSAMTKLLAIHKNILGLHDGTMGDPITLLKGAGTYGNVVRDLNFENSILDNIYNMVEERWGNLESSDQKAINTWIQKNGYDNQLRMSEQPPKPPLDVDQILTTIHEANEINKEHRDNLKKMSQKEGSILQGGLHMYMPTQTLEKIKEIVAKLGLTDFKFKPTDPKLTQEQKDEYAELLNNSEDTVTLKNGEKPSPNSEEQNNLENGIKESLTTLRDLPRSNVKTIVNKGISRGDIKNLLKRLRAKSTNYYNSAEEQTAHSAFLDTIIDVIEDGMQELSKLRLEYEKIDGVTQGRFLVESNKIRISLSRQGPQSSNPQSPQEAYAHELVHAMSYFALRSDPKLKAKIQRVYDEVKRSATENIFLPKDRKPTEDDYAFANKEYKFVFDNTDNADRLLDEFLAYGLTNQYLIDHLINFPLAKRQGWLGRLLDILEQVKVAFLRALGVKSLKATQDTAYAEIFAVAERLIAIQNKHESFVVKGERKLYENLDPIDDGIRNLLSRIVKFILQAESFKTSKLGRIVRKGTVPIYIFLGDNALAMRAKTHAAEMLNTTMRSMLNEVSEAGTLNKDYIDQLLKIRNLIAKTQYLVETYTAEWFNGSKEIDMPSIWKSFDMTKPHAMSVNTREALTSVFYRTDLSSLLFIGLSHAEIGNLVNNNKAIQTQKTKILKQLNLSVGDDVIKYTNNLGYWISTGLNKLHDGHTNVRSIAHKYKITDENDIALLDAYATLSALVSVQTTKLSGVNQDGLDEVKKLINDEFKADPKNNAIIDILDTHLDYVDKTTKNLFDKNLNQMVKGYIVERVDDLTHLETGLLKDKRAWWLKGFRHHEQLVGIKGIDNHHDTLYMAYNKPKQKDQSGLVPSTNQKHMGTTLTEILAKNPKYQIDGRPNFGKINAEIKKIKKRESAFPVVESKADVQLMPLRDDNHNIVDYRVMLSHAATKKILRPDLQIQNVFGHMKSSYIDRKYSLVEGKRTVDIAIDERNNMLDEDNRHMFIDLISPESGYIDRYRKLPKALRNYILEFVDKNGEFLVREDVVNKVFGYKPINFADVSVLQGPGMFTQAAKHAVNNIHVIAKELLGYGKDRVVIAMPEVVISNLISNIFRLGMGKIPQTYIYPKVDEGVREFFKYRKLQRERYHLQTLVDSRKLGENSPQAKELKIIISKIKNNAIHPLSEAGVNSIIVEDLNEAQIDGYINRVRRLFKSDKAAKYTSKIPPKLLEVANWIYWTKGVKGYRHMRTLVQLTDFMARYVMVSYDVDVKGIPFETAKHKAIDSFVLFDEAVAPILEMIDGIGGTSFISYHLRNQRDNTKLIKSSPTSVGISAVIQNATGIPTLANLNAGWVTGDIEPNLFQFDDLLDEATKATGFEIVSYFGDIIDEITD